MNILVINAGSSSLKYQLMNPETGDVSAKGLCERIGIDGRLTHKVGEAKTVKEIPMPTHAEAIAAVMDALVDAEIGVIKSVRRSTLSVTVLFTALTSSLHPLSLPTR